jgi:serine phosphatase RsbU (regulator of sigma subunit)/PAS domain-containing protein
MTSPRQGPTPGRTDPAAGGQPSPQGSPGGSDTLQGTLGLTCAAVCVVDSRGVISGWTPGAEALLGHPADTVVGTPGLALLAAWTEQAGGRNRTSERKRALAEKWERRSRTVGRRNHWSAVKDLRHRDGRVVRVTVEGVPLTAGDGRPHWLLWAVEMDKGASRQPVRSAVMRTLLDHAPIALAIWDTDLRCVWLNTTAEHETDALRNRAIGLPMRDALRGFDTVTIASVMRRVLADGKPVIDHEFAWRRSAAGPDPEQPVIGGGSGPGMPPDPDAESERVFASSFFRLDTESGVPVGVCTVAVDITRSWARARLSMLSKAGRRVGTTLDVATTAQELADVAVPLLADFVAVDIDESVPLGMKQHERLASKDGGVPMFRRAGVASVLEGAPDSVYELGEVVYVRRTSPYFPAATLGSSVFEPAINLTSGPWPDTEPERSVVMRATGMHSLMVVPLKARGAILGVAVFGRTENKAPFSRDDLLLAEELGLQAGLTIDNARRYTRERTAALALQRNLLPRHVSGGEALEVASRYLPTDAHEGVGGDWYDVIELSGARVALVVGDVVGHGINAAATMGRFRTAVHTLADLDLPPDEVLAHLDELAVHLSESASADAQGGGAGAPGDAAGASPMSATCVYAVYDAVTRVCSVARAGHPPPAIVDPSGSVYFPDLPPGGPIGLGLASYEAVDITLPEGSVIAMFTDGLVESRTADLDAGFERLAKTLARPELGLETLCSEVVGTMTMGTAHEDDIALLVARTRALGSDRVATWQLRAHPASVGQARFLAVGQLEEWGIGQLCPEAELIVSELVTNAVLHGEGPITLRLIRHASLVCEVADADFSSPRLLHPHAMDESGRGMLVVSKVADRWGSRTTKDGKVAWAELDLPHP